MARLLEPGIPVLDLTARAAILSEGDKSGDSGSFCGLRKDDDSDEGGDSDAFARFRHFVTLLKHGALRSCAVRKWSQKVTK